MGKITIKAAKILAKRVYQKIKEEEKNKPVETYPKSIAKLILLNENLQSQRDALNIEINKINEKRNKICTELRKNNYCTVYNSNLNKYFWVKNTNNINSNLLTKIEEDIILESEFNSASLEELENALVKRYS